MADVALQRVFTNLLYRCLPEMKYFIEGYRMVHKRTAASTGLTYKTKVAIIDNGVVLVGNGGKSGIFDQIKEGASFLMRGAEEQPWWHASGPHGTQMTGLICTIDPCCDVYIARVGDADNSGVTPRRLASVCQGASGREDILTRCRPSYGQSIKGSISSQLA
jgi:hypothetical protein